MNNDRLYIKDIDKKYPHFLYEYPTTFSMNQSDIIEGSYYKDSLVSISEESLLYIHIPFCYKICSFCNIYTTPLKEKSETDAYLDRIFQELEYVFSYLGSTYIRGIYIGGGTPTILTRDQFQKLFELLEKKIPNIRDLYIEIDAHPSTITMEQVELFENFGVKQLAIGIQSLDPNVLSILNRHHQSMDTLKRLGNYLEGTNIKIHVDFVLGLPHENLGKILEGIDLTYALLKFSSVSINRYDNTKDTEFHRVYEKLFNSNVYTKQTNTYIDIVVGYVSKKYGIVRNLTSYFEGFRKRHMNVVGVGSGSYSFIRRRGFFQNQHYTEYISHGGEFLYKGFKDPYRDEEKRMYVIHNFYGDDFLAGYIAIFGNSFEKDFADYSLTWINSKHFSTQEHVSLADFYSARIISTYENERIS